MISEFFKSIRKKYTLPILGIFFIGLFLRIYMLLNKCFWADETFYFTVAKDNSFIDILLINHWIKDNPPLFLLFVKIWSLVSNKIVWLRIPGIISYIVSFFLLVRLLKEVDKLTLSFTLLLFSISTYFIYINYWLSPFNFVIVLCLAELNLISNLLSNKISNKRFIFLFSLFNFLIINIHYSSLYLFLSYPVFLGYLLFKKKRPFKVFLKALLISFVLSLPTLYLIYVNRKDIYLLQQAGVRASFSNLLDLILYFLNYSLLRLGNICITTIFCFFIVSFVIYLIYLGIKVNRYLLSIFLSLFIPTIVFIYVFYKNGSSIIGERPLWAIHIAYLLGINLLVAGLKKANKVVYYFFVFFLIFVTGRSLIRESSSPDNYIFDGQVTFFQWNREKYDLLLLDFAEGAKENRKIISFDNDAKIMSQRTVFFDYYLNYDSRLKDLKDKRRIIAEQPKQIIKMVDKKDKLLIVNFYREGSIESRLLNDLIVKKYDAKVINYWSYVAK